MLVDPIQTAPEENYINDPGKRRIGLRARCFNVQYSG